MKLLVLLSRVPWPVEKGDKLRAFHQIRCLSEEHEIHLFALTDDKDNTVAKEKLTSYCASITFVQREWFSTGWNVLKAFFNGKPLQTGLFTSKKAANALVALVQKIEPDHIYCQLIRSAGLAESLDIPSTVDYQDVMSVNMLRRKKASPWYLKPVMAIEYRRLMKYEYAIYQQFDHHLIITATDRDLMPFEERDKIEIIPNGVDYNYFYPVDEPRDIDIVFTGNMAYPPNIDASEFLVNDILPRVKKVIPDVRVMLAGANPHARVQNLASRNVQVTGWVDDIRECYSRSRVFIAPMRIGTGLQNKLLEAMAMKTPCVTTPLANDALGAKPGKEILTADKPSELAKHLIFLIQNPEKASLIAAAGFDFVRDHYSWEESARQMSAIMQTSGKH